MWSIISLWRFIFNVFENNSSDSCSDCPKSFWAIIHLKGCREESQTDSFGQLLLSSIHNIHILQRLCHTQIHILVPSWELGLSSMEHICIRRETRFWFLIIEAVRVSEDVETVDLLKWVVSLFDDSNDSITWRHDELGSEFQGRELKTLNAKFTLHEFLVVEQSKLVPISACDHEHCSVVGASDESCSVFWELKSRWEVVISKFHLTVTVKGLDTVKIDSSVLWWDDQWFVDWMGSDWCDRSWKHKLNKLITSSSSPDLESSLVVGSDKQVVARKEGARSRRSIQMSCAKSYICSFRPVYISNLSAHCSKYSFSISWIKWSRNNRRIKS